MKQKRDVVALEGLEFYAFHGYHTQETKIGNRFIVDIEIATDFEEAAKLDDLSKTIDYQVVYEIIKVEMSKPSKLLEHVLERIINQLKIKYVEGIQSISISLAKISPSLGGKCTASKIVMLREY